MERLHLDTRLTTEDIPDLDLYMDQVIQLFENKYEKTKRTPDEKILTKTMINNYSKGKLFFPIKNKKYSPEHVMIINMIYELKSMLQIRDIKETFEELNKRMVADTFDLQKLYDSYLQFSESNLIRFEKDLQEIFHKVEQRAVQMDEADHEYVEKVLLVLSLVNMSNYYRRTAEAIVDEIAATETKKD